MSVIFMSLDNQPIIPAQLALDQYEKNNWDTSGFEGMANSFRCPIGEEPSQGFFLMTRQAVQQINTAGYKTLVMGDDNGSVTLPGIVVKQAIRLVTGASQDPNALYLVEVTDKRFIARMSIVNLRFNIRYSGASEIDPNTTNLGTPWTWAQVVSQIATVLPAGASSIVIPSSVSVSSTPENIQYDCVSGWSALADVGKRLGCELLYNPIADAFSMVQMGIGSSNPLGNQGGASSGGGLTSGPTLRTQSDLLLEDLESITGAYNYPATVSVCFPVFDADPITFVLTNRNQGYFYNVPVSGNLSIAASGTTAIVYDSMMAIWHDPTIPNPDNLAALTTRANEVATAYYAKLTGNTNARNVYSGAMAYVPGSTVCETTWRDFGDGLKTEVQRWQPTTPMPAGPKSEPQGMCFGYTTSLTLNGNNATFVISDSSGSTTRTVSAYIYDGLVFSYVDYVIQYIPATDTYLVVDPALEGDGWCASAIGKFSTGTVNIWQENTVGDETDSGITLQAYTRFVAVPAGTRVRWSWNDDSGSFVLIAMECAGTGSVNSSASSGGTSRRSEVRGGLP